MCVVEEVCDVERAGHTLDAVYTASRAQGPRAPMVDKFTIIPPFLCVEGRVWCVCVERECIVCVCVCVEGEGAVCIVWRGRWRKCRSFSPVSPV